MCCDFCPPHERRCRRPSVVEEAALFHYRVWIDESEHAEGMDVSTLNTSALSRWGVTTRGFVPWSGMPAALSEASAQPR